MRRLNLFRLFALLALMTAAFCHAQVVPPARAFEVASVKRSNPNGRGPIGLLTYSGGRIKAGFCTFKMLMMYAFDVQIFQVSGGPVWVNDERYDITAIPPDSSQSSKLNTQR